MPNCSHAWYGLIVTGTPLNTAFPDGTSTMDSLVNVFALTPGCWAATCWVLPACPQPCGRLTTPGMIASVGSTSTISSPVVERTSACSPRQYRDTSVGWTCRVHRLLPPSRDGTLCSQLLLERSWRRPISTI